MFKRNPAKSAQTTYKKPHLLGLRLIPNCYPIFSLSALFCCFFIGCIAEPEPLPTAIQVSNANSRIDRAEHPPLYQLLYDYAFLPEVQNQEQRVRLLIWLRHSQFSEYQLRSLNELHAKVRLEFERIEARQQAIIEQYEPRLGAAYDELWNELKQGTSVSDEKLEQASQALLSAKLQDQRQQELLTLRLQSIQSILKLQRPWLRSLSPIQEALLVDAIFLLRHRLDPYANPGNFRSLVGNIYIAGNWGTLTNGSYTADQDHLNIAGLWSEHSIETLQGPVFNDARRELILYMVLLEPTLSEAIEAALTSLSASETAP